MSSRTSTILPAVALRDLTTPISVGSAGIEPPTTKNLDRFEFQSLGPNRKISWKVPISGLLPAPSTPINKEDKDFLTTWKKAYCDFLDDRSASFKGCYTKFGGAVPLKNIPWDPIIWETYKEANVNYGTLFYDKDSTNYKITAGYSATGFFNGSVVMGGSFGEEMKLNEYLLDRDKKRLFKVYPQYFRFRELSTTLIRIVQELVKTPLKIVCDVLKADYLYSPVVLNLSGNIAAFDAVNTFHKVNIPSVWGIPYISGQYPIRSIAESTDRPLYLSPTILYPQSSTQKTSDVAALIQEFEVYISDPNFLSEVIPLAISMLISRNVEPVSIPERWGGGHKYVVVVSDLFPVASLVNSELSDDICVISIPSADMVYGVYPNPKIFAADSKVVPSSPRANIFVFGADSIFSFTAEDNDGKLLHAQRDFDRVGYLGWESRVMYSSAMAPNGVVSSLGTLSTPFTPCRFTGYQLAAQNVVHITCPLYELTTSESISGAPLYKDKRGISNPTMPEPPRKGESKPSFIKRAVTTYLQEGYKRDQALAISYSMWRKSRGRPMGTRSNSKDRTV